LDERVSVATKASLESSERREKKACLDIPDIRATFQFKEAFRATPVVSEKAAWRELQVWKDDLDKPEKPQIQAFRVRPVFLGQRVRLEISDV